MRWFIYTEPVQRPIVVPCSFLKTKSYLVLFPSHLVYRYATLSGVIESLLAKCDKLIIGGELCMHI